ncbi:unnamed protein product [Clonostachys byssicola]|uniref:Uncharacterized protein n=1 Tax=Clonostachys byssicola TaxID=160290 RepID=A0A9N9XUJ4_9HYPO|nr:unnamed protein product [Clonostachys byssicola]
MAPIPVYSSSPINAAAKASGVTPRTAGGDHHSAEAPETTTSAPRPQGYPVAQPGAQPTLPAAAVQTGGAAPPQTSAGLEPTPTHQLVRDGSPPAPQPGAVPVAPGTRSKIPPPPRAGESLQQQHPPVATAVPSQTTLPPQMSYPAPNPTYPPRAGSSTITAQVARSASGPVPTPLGELGPGGDGGDDGDRFSHPPGYHQNALGPGLSSRQEDQGIYYTSQQQQRFDDDQDEEGLWGAARKWATAAGNSLAQAENEVWKRINKG